jgi:tetratricopeptide (TPR) repeat protein
MRHCRMVKTVCIVLAVGICQPVLAAPADKATKHDAEGQELIAKGDLKGALKAYKAAARAAPENPAYRQEFAMVRRAAAMSDLLDREKDDAEWALTAKAMRSFYRERGASSQVLALDRRAHERLNTAETTAALAESLALLEGLPEPGRSVGTNALLAIALAHEGRMDEARAIATRCEPPDDADAELLYDLARMHALIGDRPTALRLLTGHFESTPPSRLEARTALARASTDFASLAGSEDFAKVLQTPSKIKESSCSGGTSCGNCPSRSSCKSKEAAEHKSH